MLHQTRTRCFGTIVILTWMYMSGLGGCGDVSVSSLAEKVTGLKVTGQLTTMPGYISPLAAIPQRQVTANATPLLVVFTYGNWCSAEGRGNGLRDIADAIRIRYPGERVITRAWNDQDGIEQTIESHEGPVALIGHSFGGCRTLEIAARLRRSVDWMILLDPVPCDNWSFRRPDQYFEAPANVRRAICFYRPATLWPVSYSLLHTSTNWVNRLRDWGHNDFCESSEVQQCIFNLCAWEKARPQGLAIR